MLRQGMIVVAVAALWLNNERVLADVPTTLPIEQRLEQLQQKVDQLEARQQKPAEQPAAPPLPVQSAFDPLSGAPRTGQPAPTTSETVSPLTGGWDGNRFYLKSTDGMFTLHPGVLVDIRNMTSYREHLTKGNNGEVSNLGYDTQNGFDLSRLRLTFDGSLGKVVDYYFQFSADQGSALTLFDAYGNYHLGQSPISFKVGQFKDPVWHEWNVPDGNTIAVDRTFDQFLIGGGQGPRVQGAALTYDKDNLRAQAVIDDGFNSINTKFFDSGGVGAGAGGVAGVTPTDFGLSARGEYMFFGKRSANFNPWTEYEQFSSLNAKQRILVLGAGADYTQGGDNSVISHTIDIQFNDPCGFSAYAAYLGSYRNLHTNQGVKPGHYYDEGFQLEAAWVFSNRVEPFVRYDYTHLAPASTASVTGLRSHVVQAITAGVNCYLYGQKAKLTLDGTFLPNGSPVDADALGFLRNSGHNEFVLRAQFQIAI